MTKRNYLYIAASLFLIVGLIHLARILTEFEITIFGLPYPYWLSWSEMIIAFLLSFYGFKLAGKEQ